MCPIIQASNNREFNKEWTSVMDKNEEFEKESNKTFKHA